jgi:uncharacterized protein (DUF362 family)
MEADAKPCGVLVAGINPVAVDWVATRLMGFDGRKVPTVREGLQQFELSAGSIQVVPELGAPFRFRPHFGWVGHIEQHDALETTL